MLARELRRRTAVPLATLRRRLLSSSAAQRNVIDELEQRGMIQDLTSRAVRAHVETPTAVYLGMDPSARSLHVGNLLALIGLVHFRLQGHTSVCLIGGATGAVGDPSGRSTERNALAPEMLAANIAAITEQVVSLLERGVPFAESRNRSRQQEQLAHAPVGHIEVVNNHDWLGGISLLAFLGGVGKSARISTMLARESVKSRLDSKSGLSFTEFTYQLLQAYDFYSLYKHQGCTIQLGGSDQLGNIMSGIEMIRKENVAAPTATGSEPLDPAYGVTMPLLTTASGEKFGKSAGNAVWLDPTMTSPFHFYQFFLRTTDEDVLRYLKIFSFIRVIELEGVMEEHEVHKGQRFAQKLLAAEATELVHGGPALKQALAASALFYATDLSKLDSVQTIKDLDAHVDPSAAPSSQLASMLTRISGIEVLGMPIADLALLSGIVSTKCTSDPSRYDLTRAAKARAAVEAGTLHLNGARLAKADHQRKLELQDVLVGGLLTLRLGKNEHRAILLE